MLVAAWKGMFVSRLGDPAANRGTGVNHSASLPASSVYRVEALMMIRSISIPSSQDLVAAIA